MCRRARQIFAARCSQKCHNHAIESCHAVVRVVPYETNGVSVEALNDAGAANAVDYPAGAAGRARGDASATQHGSPGRGGPGPVFSYRVRVIAGGSKAMSLVRREIVLAPDAAVAARDDTVHWRNNGVPQVNDDTLAPGNCPAHHANDEGVVTNGVVTAQNRSGRRPGLHH